MRQMIDQLETRQFLSTTVAANEESYRVYQDGKGTVAAFIPVDAKPVTITSLKVSRTGTLFITGTGKADNIAVQVSNGKIVNDPTFVVESTNSDGEIVRLSPALASLPKIKRVSIDTLGGNDRVTVIADVPVSVRTARGDDNVVIYAPTRTIEGGSGSNTIREDENNGVHFVSFTGVASSGFVVPIKGSVNFVPVDPAEDDKPHSGHGAN
jgi:hypothetical protein